MQVDMQNFVYKFEAEKMANKFVGLLFTSCYRYKCKTRNSAITEWSHVSSTSHWNSLEMTPFDRTHTTSLLMFNSNRVSYFALLCDLKEDRQRFLQQVSKKQFRTLYHNANTCG